jgi:hypothetical protein
MAETTLAAASASAAAGAGAAAATANAAAAATGVAAERVAPSTTTRRHSQATRLSSRPAHHLNARRAHRAEVQDGVPRAGLVERARRTLPPAPMSAPPSGERARAAAWSLGGEGTCRCLELALSIAHGSQMDLPSALRRQESHSFEGAPLQLPTPHQHGGRPLLFELQNPVLPTNPASPPFPLAHRLHARPSLDCGYHT